MLFVGRVVGVQCRVIIGIVLFDSNEDAASNHSPWYGNETLAVRIFFDRAGGFRRSWRRHYGQFLIMDARRLLERVTSMLNLAHKVQALPLGQPLSVGKNLQGLAIERTVKHGMNEGATVLTLIF